MQRDRPRSVLKLRRTTEAWSCVAIYLFALALYSAICSHADTLPPFKPGLWETKTTMNGVTRTTKACVTSNVDRNKNGLARPHCQETATRTATGYDVSMHCAFGPATIGGVNHVTGDFETIVRMEAVAAPDDLHRSRPTTVSMEMRRLGDCE